MSTARMTAAGMLAAVAVIVAGYWAQPGGQRAGQVLLVPADRQPTREVDQSLGGVVISRCEPTDDGLAVVGHVEPGSGAVTVLVWPADPAQPGVRRSLGEAWGLTQIPTPTFGDFLLVLPSADTRASFAVAVYGDSADAAGPWRHGPVVGCP